MAIEALLFSGQGAQHVGMGKSLYDSFPVVKSLWDQANEVLGFDLRKLTFEGPEEALTETKVCQPALFVHGYSIYRVLQEKGKLDELKVAMGLSLGELTALAVAGVYDFETGLQVVAKRGALMQEACEATTGGMASIIGGELTDVQNLCDTFDIDMANLNSPGQIVISGELEKVNAAVEAAADKGFKRVIPLKVAGAYHSRLMSGAAEKFESYLSGVKFEDPILQVFTNVTGELVSGEGEIKEALVKQVVSSVRWVECMEGAINEGVTKMCECGPGKVLKGLGRRINADIAIDAISEASDLES